MFRLAILLLVTGGDCFFEFWEMAFSRQIRFPDSVIREPLKFSNPVPRGQIKLPEETTPPTTAAPPSSTTKPPSPTTKPPSPTTTPPSPTTARPSPTTTRPSPTTARPSPTTTRPSPTTARPSPTTTPPSSTTKPPSSTTKPPSSTTARPSSTTARPSSTTAPPSSTTARPSPTTARPSPTTARPSSTPAPLDVELDSAGIIAFINGFRSAIAKGVFPDGSPTKLAQSEGLFKIVDDPTLAKYAAAIAVGTVDVRPPAEYSRAVYSTQLTYASDSTFVRKALDVWYRYAIDVLPADNATYLQRDVTTLEGYAQAVYYKSVRGSCVIRRNIFSTPSGKKGTILACVFNSRPVVGQTLYPVKRSPTQGKGCTIDCSCQYYSGSNGSKCDTASGLCIADTGSTFPSHTTPSNGTTTTTTTPSNTTTRTTPSVTTTTTTPSNTTTRTTPSIITTTKTPSNTTTRTTPSITTTTAIPSNTTTRTTPSITTTTAIPSNTTTRTTPSITTTTTTPSNTTTRTTPIITTTTKTPSNTTTRTTPRVTTTTKTPSNATRTTPSITTITTTPSNTTTRTTPSIKTTTKTPNNTTTRTTPSITTTTAIPSNTTTRTTPSITTTTKTSSNTTTSTSPSITTTTTTPSKTTTRTTPSITTTTTTPSKTTTRTTPSITTTTTTPSKTTTRATPSITTTTTTPSKTTTRTTPRTTTTAIPPSQSVTNEIASKIVDRHNHYRSMVARGIVRNGKHGNKNCPSATNMHKLSYDWKEGVHAQKYADRCPTKQRATFNNSSFGQNVYIVHSHTIPFGKAFESAVDTWFNEISKSSINHQMLFTPMMMTKKNGPRRFTQLAWGKTRLVGCGAQRCGHRTVVVCRYQPAGNILGQYVYDKGKTCASCKHSCQNSLCV